MIFFNPGLRQVYFIIRLGSVFRGSLSLSIKRRED